VRCAHRLLWFGVPDRICCLGSCAQEQANNSIRNVTEWESGVGCGDSLKAKTHSPGDVREPSVEGGDRTSGELGNFRGVAAVLLACQRYRSVGT